MRFHVMTLFPELINGYMGSSIMKRAAEKNLISVKTWNIRDYSENKHKKVDDYPYGGGAGMVMTPAPIMNCYKAIQAEIAASSNAESKAVKLIYLSPKGKMLTNEKAVALSREEELILLCGHYEGVDQRIIDRIVSEEISIGDYVLTGGELPALVLIDSISRHIPGVLGTSASLSEESFTQNWLEYPHYTRPESYEGMQVPKVLLSGNHQLIEEWRRYQSICTTRKKRPDLFRMEKLSRKDYKIIEKYEGQEAAMQINYAILFFDMDNTLFDFDRAEEEALKATMATYGLSYDSRKHLDAYIKINEVLWAQLERGEITQEELKIERFRLFADQIGTVISPRDLSEAYLKQLSSMVFLKEGALEVLEYLRSRRYRLGLITNGITEVQKGRLRRSGIENFFEVIVISAEAGVSKPSKEIFSYAMQQAGCLDKTKALMIGDSLASDIAGGIGFGMPTCWLNEEGHPQPPSWKIDYEIHSLWDLKNIL